MGVSYFFQRCLPKNTRCSLVILLRHESKLGNMIFPNVHCLVMFFFSLLPVYFQKSAKIGWTHIFRTFVLPWQIAERKDKFQMTVLHSKSWKAALLLVMATLFDNPWQFWYLKLQVSAVGGRDSSKKIKLKGSVFLTTRMGRWFDKLISEVGVDNTFGVQIDKGCKRIVRMLMFMCFFFSFAICLTFGGFDTKAEELHTRTHAHSFSIRWSFLNEIYPDCKVNRTV